MNTLVRCAVGSLLIAGIVAMVACASTSPSPTASPTKLTATSVPPAKPTSTAEAKPTAAATQAAKPAASPVAKPASSAGRKAEWDKTVADAKKEGRVVVAGGSGESFRLAAFEFRKAYPDITLEFSGAGGSEIGPKILAEQKGGQYLWDVYIGGSTTVLQSFLPNKVLAPLRPALMLPEVLDDSKWHQGFENGWMDLGRQYNYAFFGYLSVGAWVNRDIAPESELKTIEQLADPKWKSKIAWLDPRKAGSGRMYATHLVGIGKEDLLSKLLAQDLVVHNDNRMLLEGLVRGRYAVGFGVGTSLIKQFQEEGLLGGVEPLDPYGAAGGMMNAGTGHVSLFDKAPNPNAAKVFINWLLSQEGQKAYVHFVNNNSRRLDVEGPPETAPRPGVKYRCATHEETLADDARAAEIAKRILQ